MWQPLFANLAVTAMMLVAWNAFSDHAVRFSETTRKILFGTSLAVSTVGSMMMSYEVRPGIFFDMRGPLIAVASFFGGAPAAVIASGAALAYRIHLGGAVGTGALGIALTAAIGLAGFWTHRRRQVRHVDLIALGMAVALATTLVVFTLPAAVLPVVLNAMAAPIFVTFVATVLLGLVLLGDERRRDLATTNDLYRSMVETLPDCLNIKDVDGRFLAANPATADLMRAANAADLLGKSDFDFYPHDLARDFLRDEQAVLHGGVPVTIEQCGRLPDGSPGWLSTLKAPVTDRGGRIVGLVTHNRDITARKALQNKLAETQHHLDQAIENMNDGLAMYDPKGHLLFCNERYRKLFPLTAHLRVPGAAFADIMRASIASGEELVPAGSTIDRHVAEKFAGLQMEGEHLFTLGDGRTFASRTKVLASGSTLRMMADVTERQSFEKNLEHQALHDPLTGLPNRTYFSRELDRLLNKTEAEGGDLLVMLLDLDRFKEVNDTFGHAAGDAFLVEVARRLRDVMRKGDFVARLGGDEFAILMHADAIGGGDAAMAARVISRLKHPLQIGDVTLLPSGTVGYTVFPKDMSDMDTLLKNADRALYQAKARGRGTWKAFEPGETATRAATA